MSNLVIQAREALVSRALAVAAQPRLWHQVPTVDQELLLAFVEMKGAGSDKTFRRYFRVLSQLMMWLDKPLKALTSADMRLYQRFLASPPQPFQDLSEYPFAPANPKTIDDVFVVIKSFCTFLMNEQVLHHNPAKNVAKLQRTAKGETKNFFNRVKWRVLWEAIDALPYTSAREQHQAERLRFMFAISYGLALRPDEAATHTMMTLYPSEGSYKIDISGKGNKARTLRLDPDTVSAIQRYRKFLGLPPDPQGEPIPFLPCLYPIVRKSRGPNKGLLIKKGISSAAWRMEFKETLEKAYRRLYEIPEGTAITHTATWQKEWAILSPHGLRHTRISHLAIDQQWDALRVMRFAGHESLSTTQVYFHFGVEE